MRGREGREELRGALISCVIRRKRKAEIKADRPVNGHVAQIIMYARFTSLPPFAESRSEDLFT